MPKVAFTNNLKRHIEVPEMFVAGTTVFELMNQIFDKYPALRSYILDDRNRLRQHVNIFINGQFITDRETLSDPVTENSDIFVMQALSGG